MSSATTLLSSVSAVSLPGPTHTPSQTPLIAGSLTGLIVLLVCLVTLFLLHRRRLFAQRIRQQENFSSNYLRASLHLRCLSNSISARQTPFTPSVRGSPSSTAYHFLVWILSSPFVLSSSTTSRLYYPTRRQTSGSSSSCPWFPWPFSTLGFVCCPTLFSGYRLPSPIKHLPGLLWVFFRRRAGLWLMMTSILQLVVLIIDQGLHVVVVSLDPRPIRCMGMKRYWTKHWVYLVVMSIRRRTCLATTDERSTAPIAPEIMIIIMIIIQNLLRRPGE